MRFKEVYFLTGAEHKVKTLEMVLRKLGVGVEVVGVRPSDKAKENHGEFNPEEFILDKAVEVWQVMKSERKILGRKMIMVHDFMAAGKVLGEENNHVFLNKPPDGMDSLEWFWRKMNELRERAGEDGVVELTFRNLVALGLPESLSFNWRIRYDWHMEAIRLILSSGMLELLCDWDKLRELNEQYDLANSRSAGGVDLMIGLLPMLLEIAAKKADDDLNVWVEHKLAIPGKSGVYGCVHKIDSRDDLNGDNGFEAFTKQFANGFSKQFTEGVLWRVKKLEGGQGKIIMI